MQGCSQRGLTERRIYCEPVRGVSEDVWAESDVLCPADCSHCVWLTKKMVGRRIVECGWKSPSAGSAPVRKSPSAERHRPTARHPLLPFPISRTLHSTSTTHTMPPQPPAPPVFYSFPDTEVLVGASPAPPPAHSRPADPSRLPRQLRRQGPAGCRR